MTLKTLALTLTSLILLAYIMIGFREYKPVQKYSRSLALFFMLTLKKLKTIYVMINLHLFIPNKGTYIADQLY